MSIKNLFIFFVFSLYSGLFAQEKFNIAVMDLDPEGIPDSENKIISARLRSDLFNTNKFDILEREKMEEVLQEQGFQLTGCTSDECAVEIGRLVGVNRIVAGSIGRIGSIYTLNIRLINVETGRVEKTATEDCQCTIETVLTQAINRVARKLAGEDVTPVPSQLPKVKPTTQPPKQPPTSKKTTIYRPRKKTSKYKAFFGFSLNSAEYDIASDFFKNDIYTYKFKPDLKNNMEFLFGAQLPLKIDLSGFLRLHKFDENIGTTTYSGLLFIVGPRIQYNLKWFYCGYSLGFIKLRFDENSEASIFGSSETDYDKTVSMYSCGLNVPVLKNFHLTADYSIFNHYKAVSYGLLLLFN